MLLRAFRDGDTSAGYELLGRQATIDQWNEALSLFARSPADVDLERIAGSTLGRQPEVVASVIDLLEATGTSQALVVAHAAARLRSEPHLVERARAVATTLLETHRPLLDDEAGDARQSLFVLLVLPPAEQKEVWHLWRAALPARAASVEGALRVEDDRLLRLSKERSYRAGSFLHFYRHALADLVLIAGIDDSLGRRAFSLLQRRVDEAEEQEPLLLVVPEETRRRYLRWAIDLKNSGAVPRTRFALRMLREHFHDAVEPTAILALCERAAPEVAFEAARTALELSLAGTGLAQQLARLINELDEDLARPLAAIAVVTAPEQVRLDLVVTDRVAWLFEEAKGSAEPFAHRVASELATVQPADEVSVLLTGLERLDVSAEPFELAANAVLRRVQQGEPIKAVIDEALIGARFRAGAWRALPTLPLDAVIDAAPLLISREVQTQRVRRVVEVLASLEDEARPRFASVVLEVATRGEIEIEDLASSWPEELGLYALDWTTRANQDAEAELGAIRERLELGERVYIADLRSYIGPLVDRALERARGNQRLEEGYGRLNAALKDGAKSTAAEDKVRTDSSGFADELARAGATLDAADGAFRVTFHDSSPALDVSRLRLLGALDQRQQRLGPGSERQTIDQVLSALAAAAGNDGLAERAVTDLFEGGPLLQIAKQLSGHARELLFSAAEARGWRASAEWLEHRALGEWLRRRQIQSGPGDVGGGFDLPTLRTALRLARDSRAQVEAARNEVALQEHVVKEALAHGALRVFEELDLLMDSYAQLWHGLSKVGIRRIAPLGAVLLRAEIEPDRHEIVGEAKGDRFVVRTSGIEVDDRVLVPARVEAAGD
jgi:hypothetical protein